MAVGPHDKSLRLQRLTVRYQTGMTCLSTGITAELLREDVILQIVRSAAEIRRYNHGEWFDFPFNSQYALYAQPTVCADRFTSSTGHKCMSESTQISKVVPWHDVKIGGGFWSERQATNRERTISAVYYQSKITGRLDAWKIARESGQPEPHIFCTSDTAKWIEAVGYSVATHPNAEFERQVDEVVDLIEKAQLADGYTNSHFIVVEPENCWRNLRDQHELYCAGHLIEAAITYSQTTGKQKLLDILCRYADHIDATFGPKEERTETRLSRSSGTGIGTGETVPHDRRSALLNAVEVFRRGAGAATLLRYRGA